MKLNVHVLDRHVGVLEQVGDFKSVMTYIPEVASEELVSLTMPVRTESYLWDDELHPIFRMNLPEGYLLQVLQEEFGPHIGASPEVASEELVSLTMPVRTESYLWDDELHPIFRMNLVIPEIGFRSDWH